MNFLEKVAETYDAIKDANGTFHVPEHPKWVQFLNRHKGKIAAGAGIGLAAGLATSAMKKRKAFQEKQAEESHTSIDSLKNVVSHGLMVAPIGAAAGFGVGKGIAAMAKNKTGSKILSKVFHDPNSVGNYAPGLGLLFGAEHGFGLGSEVGTAEAAKRGNQIKVAAVESLCESGLDFDTAIKLVKEAGMFDSFSSFGSAIKSGFNSLGRGLSGQGFGPKSFSSVPVKTATIGIRG